MYPLFILGSLLPATLIAVLGFFTLYAADRSAGRLRAIGRILGYWLFILALLVVAAAAVGSIVGPRHWSGMAHHHNMMGPGGTGWSWPEEKAPPAGPSRQSPPAARSEGSARTSG